ncbi:aromatic ring-hydroxylating oxygenase subunit alpha [Sphingomonas sp. ID0503]|uniref:aromatic ring-hydroxylating oxygenase subunit alpha n=1 Tax=Sphingomonas sp. ID0503 TaxID=3399691 RepID=UPI003AFA0F28
MGAEHQRFATGSRGDLTEAAGLATTPVPLEPYRSRAFFELERDRIFKRAWLMLCREEELPEVGSYVVREIRPCNVSTLVTRSKNGIQAFYNSCSHRGSQVVNAPQGKSARFVCPYHKWTYSSDGRLMGITDESNFFEVNKADCGLTKMSTGVWEGWVFVNLQREPEVSLDEFLGDLKQHLAGFYYQGAENPVVFTAELDANWKVVADAFIETYHIPHIHPETIGTTFASAVNPHSRLLSATQLKPHQAVSMFGNPDYALDPNNKVEALAAAAAGESGNVISAATKEDAARFLAHPAINPTRSTHWSMDVNHIFPHVHIDTGPGGFWVHHFWPVSENTSFYEGRFYMKQATTIQERFLQEIYINRVAEVVLEDLVNVARTQAGIDSCGKESMQLQDSEVAIRYSVDQVLKWVAADSVAEALA